jgi:hypothetical protein
MRAQRFEHLALFAGKRLSEPAYHDVVRERSSKITTLS